MISEEGNFKTTFQHTSEDIKEIRIDKACLGITRPDIWRVNADVDYLLHASGLFTLVMCDKDGRSMSDADTPIFDWLIDTLRVTSLSRNRHNQVSAMTSLKMAFIACMWLAYEIYANCQ